MKEERGSALLVVFILLTLLGAIALSNVTVLRNLRREIRLVEKQQLKKYTQDRVQKKRPGETVPHPTPRLSNPTNAPASLRP